MLSMSKAKTSGPLFDKNVKHVTDQVFESRMKAVTGITAGKISDLTPVGSTGALSQSIAQGWTVRKTRKGWLGRIAPTEAYGSIIEFGRKYPGKFPPISAIEYWLKRKGRRLGLPQGKRMAFLIARKIARKGFKEKRGYQMHQKGLKVMKPYINRTLGKIATDIARKLD